MVVAAVAGNGRNGTGAARAHTHLPPSIRLFRVRISVASLPWVIDRGEWILRGERETHRRQGDRGDVTGR